jgi:hypothetical protein
VIDIILAIVFPKAELHFAQRAAKIGRRPMNPSERYISLLVSSARSYRKACSISEEPDGLFTLRVGKSQHKCRITPQSCDCFEYVWYGRKCIHLAALELDDESSSSSETDAAQKRAKPAKSGPNPMAAPQRKPKRGAKALKRFAVSKAFIRQQLDASSSEDNDEEEYDLSFLN